MTKPGDLIVHLLVEGTLEPYRVLAIGIKTPMEPHHRYTAVRLGDEIHSLTVCRIVSSGAAIS